MYELINAAELGFPEIDRPLRIVGSFNGKHYYLYRFALDDMNHALEVLHALNHPGAGDAA